MQATQMTFPPKLYYGLRGAKGFKECVATLGSYKRLDDAIVGLYEILRSNPKIYSLGIIY